MVTHFKSFVDSSTNFFKVFSIRSSHKGPVHYPCNGKMDCHFALCVCVCVCVCVCWKGGVKGNNSLIDVSHHTMRFYSPELISTDQPNVLDVVT